MAFRDGATNYASFIFLACLLICFHVLSAQHVPDTVFDFQVIDLKKKNDKTGRNAQ